MISKIEYIVKLFVIQTIPNYFHKVKITIEDSTNKYYERIKAVIFLNQLTDFY